MAESSNLALTDEIKDLIAGALDSGNILLLAVVSDKGKPLLSFRGSTSVFSDTQLSFWARNLGGETLEAIVQNPQVALMYRSTTVPLLQFHGRARITADPAERDRAFELSHEKERSRDQDRKGAAVIIDLDEVSGVLAMTKDGPVFCKMHR